jgi:protein-L-isoaspartate(D-aspartate) O-methyltransferase
VSAAAHDARVDDEEAASLRRDLVDTLRRNGDLNDPAWRAAFASVPRHVFVPRWYRTHLDDGRLCTEIIDATDPSWLATVYADQFLQTRRDVTSSSTTPGLMARMLEALEVTGTERVLEIGTGTGYNAALLSERLGSGRTTSIDIDPELVDEARDRLAHAGYAPNVAVGDGAHGHPPLAPYDRILATCRVDYVPQSWCEQLTADGVIVAPLGVGIVRIVRDPDNAQNERRVATGRFLSGPAYFMPLRTSPGRENLTAIAHSALHDPGTTRQNSLDTDIFTDTDARTWLELAVPGIVRGSTRDLDFAYHRDGSWARLTDGTVTQNGPRALWDDIEAAYADWLDNRRPGLDRYGVTITHHHQHLWLDTPTAVIRDISPQ